jgi:hexokinase
MAKLTAQSSKALDDFFNNLQDNIENVEPDNLQIVIQDFIKKVQKNLKDKDLEASGKLSASIQPLPIQKEPGVLKVSIEIEDYWRQVEEGTKPLGFTKENRKKLQPKILRWIKEKPSLQSKVEASKRLSLSYAIATNILKKGTIKRFNYKGFPFLTKELNTFKKKILKAYEDGINDI